MYFVTAGTYLKQHFFREEERLEFLQEMLFDIFEEFDWQPHAWAIFSNHYHFIARAPENAESLKAMLQKLHSITARQANEWDQTPGRKVWYRYRDTCLTYEASYFARLNYVHHNPVKHGVASLAENYRFCSAGWFAVTAERTFRDKVLSFKWDKANIDDEY